MRHLNTLRADGSLWSHVVIAGAGAFGCRTAIPAPVVTRGRR